MPAKKEAAQRECHGQEGELATDDPDDAAEREVEEAQARPLVRLGLGQRQDSARTGAPSVPTVQVVRRRRPPIASAGKFEIR